MLDGGQRMVKRLQSDGALVLAEQLLEIHLFLQSYPQQLRQLCTL